MKREFRKGMSLPLLALGAATLGSQRATIASAGKASDQSFYLGQLVTNPENLSGLWEAPDRRGGVIALQLTLLTTAPAAAKTLVGTPQSWFALEVATYQSSGAALDYKNGNSFSDSEGGAGLRYDRGHLTLHYGAFDLDLVHNARDQWKGHLRRPGFGDPLTLKRPGARRAKSNLEGSWLSGTASSQTCLHIAHDSPSHYVGWVDNLQTWGQVRFARDVPKPQFSSERYGELVNVEDAGNGHALVTLGAYSGLCCSHTFVATVAGDGTSMQAAWPPGANQAPQTTTWTRMAGNSCLGPTLASRPDQR